eukprot:4559251-Pleurochrysis_carterae.AAC.2
MTTHGQLHSIAVLETRRTLRSEPAPDTLGGTLPGGIETLCEKLDNFAHRWPTASRASIHRSYTPVTLEPVCGRGANARRPAADGRDRRQKAKKAGRWAVKAGERRLG